MPKWSVRLSVQVPWTDTTPVNGLHVLLKKWPLKLSKYSICQSYSNISFDRVIKPSTYYEYLTKAHLQNQNWSLDYYLLERVARQGNRRSYKVASPLIHVHLLALLTCKSMYECHSPHYTCEWQLMVHPDIGFNQLYEIAGFDLKLLVDSQPLS